MDDTTIICSKEDETRRMLTRLDDLMSRCRMEFKPKKSRSLSIRRGKVNEATTFTVAEQQIPTISQEPVKSLGRWYDSSMKDTRQGAETLDLASESLLAINKCGLQGKFKIWCLQFMLIPKLLWPLLVYDICSSTVEAIEAKINKYTRKWLGVPPGLSDVAIMEEAHAFKEGKYLDLTELKKKDGYEAKVMPVEIGARGFVGSSAYGLLSKLSIGGNKRTKALRLLAETAENSSRWIWSRRNERLLHRD
ncbi:reverse transcriptase [Plakobranchus ocellatus]|uniref:Reverse transcriptase n=1 Tax=Plakobranchus ocellatus TaxID=259542 RepID=A0AAV3Y5F9_9GAST|nr:reverse transcriptase [Plakobranchus ocellatus]